MVVQDKSPKTFKDTVVNVGDYRYMMPFCKNSYVHSIKNYVENGVKVNEFKGVLDMEAPIAKFQFESDVTVHNQLLGKEIYRVEVTTTPREKMI